VLFATREYWDKNRACKTNNWVGSCSGCVGRLYNSATNYYPGNNLSSSSQSLLWPISSPYILLCRLRTVNGSADWIPTCVRARMPAFCLILIRMVIIRIRLQT